MSLKKPSNKVIWPEAWGVPRVTTTFAPQLHRDETVCDDLMLCKKEHHDGPEEPLPDDDNPLLKMQQFSERQPGSFWAAYQDMELNSAPNAGSLRFLVFGPTCTVKTAEDLPNKYPDTHLGTGWRFLHVGYVDLKTGLIHADLCGLCGSGLAEPSDGPCSSCAQTCARS